jgi:pimeloyl-ACP methyl ester carboxylesterase
VLAQREDDTVTTIPLSLLDLGTVEVTTTDQGAGRPVLLLHGGAGPQSVSAFADRLAAERGVRVLTPTHPGFAGTPRPEGLRTIAALASVYAALLEALDLTDVVVVGNSIGGWTAAELALLHSPRVGALVLVDAVGIDVPGHPVADFFALSFPELAQLSYADPDRFRIDPTALPPAAQAAMAGNRATLAVYTADGMTDPTLLPRLGGIDVPTVVVWGEADGIVDATVGRTYADAVPGARFELLTGTGHLPQLESPDRLIAVIADTLD